MSSADRLLVDGYNAIEADIFFPRTTDDNFSENSTTDSPSTTSFPSSEPNVGLIVGLSVTVACLIACLGLLIHFRSKWLKFCKPCGCSCSCFCSGSRKAETSNQEFVESQVHSSPYPPNSHQPVPTVSATVDHLLDSPVPIPRTNPQINRPETKTNFISFSSGISSNLSSESHNSNIYKSSPPNSFTNSYKLEPYAPPSTNSGVLLAPPIPPKSINRADRATPFTAGVTISQEIFMSLVSPDSDRDTELHRNAATAPRGLPLPKYPLGSPLTSMNAAILAEFNRLHFKEKPTTVALLPENHFKNRYSDTIPYDENRVIISTGQYINASHIDHNFIVAQDPIQASGDVDLFWTMIWEKNIHIIVRLSSDDFSLAYMPLDKRWVLENCLQVSPLLGPTDEPQSYTHRVVKLATTRGVNEREVLHYHLRNWASNKPPPKLDFLQVLVLIRHRLAMTGDSDARVLVHCGAGSSRSGTMVAVWKCMDAIDSFLIPDVFSIVQKIRDQRAQAVNKPELYEYIYECAALYKKERESLNASNPYDFYDAGLQSSRT